VESGICGNYGGKEIQEENSILMRRSENETRGRNVIWRNSPEGWKRRKNDL
jgi:hypothetical protein